MASGGRARLRPSRESTRRRRLGGSLALPFGHRPQKSVSSGLRAGGFCRSAFDNKPEFRNPMGALQGGFVAAMLDDTMAVGGLFKIGGGYVVPTLEMKVNFVRPATTDEVFAEGWLVHAGRTVAFLGGRLLDANEEVCATATATAIIRPFKRIEE